MILQALAGGIGLSAYLNAKYHISKDLSHLYYLRRGAKYQEKLKRQGKVNIWTSFTENAVEFAEQDCIWFADRSTNPSTSRTLTWKQAHDYACQFAQWFLQAGVPPGECVGFYLQNSPEFVLAWMGLLAIGCWPAMINYNLVGDALVHCVKLAGCRLLLVDEDFHDRVLRNDDLRAMGINMIIVDDSLRRQVAAIAPATPSHELTRDCNEKTRLALRYTSGTTGFPKGVMATTGRYYSRLAAQFTQMGIRPLRKDGSGDRWYICMPMCHSTAGSAAIICLLMPTTLCIGKRFSASRFWNEVRSSRATVGTYVGEIARYLLALPPSTMDPQHNLRMMYGNGMRPDVWGRFQDRFAVPDIAEFYGSTEGGLSHLTIQKGLYLRDAVGHDGLIRRWQLHDQVIPVLVDAETNEIVRGSKTGFATRMPYEIGGELLFRLESEAGFVGYWSNPEATQKKLARNVFKEGDLFYRSGDSLKRSSDGAWSFLDRLGDTFRWKGENVSTAEVSERLGSYPGVVDANVYGVQIPNHDGRAGCAALMLASNIDQDFDMHGLLRHARENLPHYAVPLFLRIVEQAALNSNGLKQDKVKPRAEGVDPSRVGTDLLYVLRGNGYVEFTAKDWEDLMLEKARL